VWDSDHLLNAFDFLALASGLDGRMSLICCDPMPQSTCTRRGPGRHCIQIRRRRSMGRAGNSWNLDGGIWLIEC
jgi:hypothetical protein